MRSSPTALLHDSPRREAALWSTIAVLPFLLFPAAHWAVLGDQATGLTTYDLPYYAANARALLERGHAGLGPNAFDPAPEALAIYFHWLISLLALLIGPLGLDPGVALLLIQMIGGWMAARLMFALVKTIWTDRPHFIPAYLSIAWGGGLLIVGKLCANAASGREWRESLLAMDPGQGLWCLNFGRNLILPTEAVYHALMTGLWLAVIRERWKAAGVVLWLLATTHPFTAAQALAIVGAWIAVLMLFRRRRPPVFFLVNFIVVSAVFAAYYFIYLPSFPAHRELEQTWALGWTLTPAMMLLAYGPAAVLAAVSIARDREWRRSTAFFAVAATVSFLLANHHWFITPRQPIHFTRGYIWTPLWLMGLPALASALSRLRRARPGVGVAGIVLSGLLVVSDNAGFLVLSPGRVRDTGFSLSQAERQAFAAISAIPDPGVLLTDTERLGYLAAVYTPARPYLGHKYNTPGFELRRARQRELLAGNRETALLDEVDLVLTESAEVAEALDRRGATRVGQFGSLQLWRRRPAQQFGSTLGSP